MPRKRSSELMKGLLARTLADGRTVFYGDFRKLGGGQEALKGPGEKSATDDLDLAETIYQARALELKRALKDRAENRVLQRVETAPIAFGPAVKEFIKVRLEESSLHTRWETETRRILARAQECFAAMSPPVTDLRTVTPVTVRAFVRWMRSQVSARGGTFSDNSIRAHIFALSGLFTYLVETEQLPTNPVKSLPKRAKPRMQRRIAWLDADEASLLLHAARLVAAEAIPGRVTAMAELILATMLYTGAGPAEATQLRVADISLEHNSVRIRGTKTKAKTDARDRSVPLWPEYRAILERYWEREPPGAFLLRSRTKVGHPIIPTTISHDVLPAVVARYAEVRAEHKIGVGQPLWRHMPTLVPYDLRHTYCSARIMTTYLGTAVPMMVVATEMGHSNTDTTERIYAHLGTTTRRTDAVEYPMAFYFPKIPTAE